MPDSSPIAGQTWETRPYQDVDEPELRACLRETFDRGELPGRPWYDVEQLLTSMPESPEETIVGIANGSVVGFLTPHQQQLVVHPNYRRRGFGARLVDAGLMFSRQHGESTLTIAPPPGSSLAEAFATRQGFSYDSSLWLLRLPADCSLAGPEFPSTVVTRAFGPNEDLAKYVGMINTAFIEHPSPIFVSVEAVQRAHARPTFVPDDTLLVAERGDPVTPIAFCRTRIDTNDHGSRIGEISLIGVAAHSRGKGLGRELLRWGVAYLREQAVDDVTLHVEAKNERALGLYERAGFVRGQEWPRWTRSVPPR